MKANLTFVARVNLKDAAPDGRHPIREIRFDISPSGLEVRCADVENVEYPTTWYRTDTFRSESPEINLDELGEYFRFEPHVVWIKLMEMGKRICDLTPGVLKLVAA